MYQVSKNTIFIFLLLFILGKWSGVSAQGESEIRSITLLDNLKFENEIVNPKPISMGMFEEKSPLLKDYQLEIPVLPTFSYNVYKIPALPDFAPGANFNLNQPNYDYLKFYPINYNSALILNNNQLTLPGLGASNSLSATYLLQPHERLSISLSGTGMRYVDFGGLKNNFSASGSARFALSDRIGINTFGTYSLYQLQNADYNTMMLSPFDHQTSYGGSIDFRITEHWGVEVGTITQFNPFTRKWETIPFAAPKYYK
ncbi:MAG: hypothetical protein GX102_03450 [Porphyromonadaceae bacterium]|jgi:hypothetical protein|nr:hypothetical protein [Porphyromonadaceae bacterium]